MKNIILVDSQRSFLDGRPAHTCRSSKKAIEVLTKHEKEITILWLDNIKDSDMLIDYLTLRAKIGNKYPFKMINIHAPYEGDWQVLSTKLKRVGYPVRRATIRDTLGAY